MKNHKPKLIPDELTAKISRLDFAMAMMIVLAASVVGFAALGLIMDWELSR